MKMKMSDNCMIMANFARVFIVLALPYVGGQNQLSSLKCKIYFCN